LTWAGDLDLTGTLTELTLSEANVNDSAKIKADSLRLSADTTTLILSNKALIAILKDTSDSTKLNVTSSTLKFDDEDAISGLFEENIGLLTEVGKSIKGVDGGDIVLTGTTADIYYAGETGFDAVVDSPTAVANYKAVVLGDGKSLTANLDGATATEDMVINNLIGVEGTTLTLNNATTDTNVNVILTNDQVKVNDQTVGVDTLTLPLAKA
jgi:hypothetical protein